MVVNMYAPKRSKKMIKLSDFARRQGVTPRAVQRLVKKYESEISEHIEKKGQNGTWLDDVAQEYLRSKMKQNPVVVYGESADPLIEENQVLRAELADLRKELSDAYKHLANVLEESKATQFQLQIELAEQKLLSAGREEAEKKVTDLELALTDAREHVDTLKDIAEANGQEAARAKADVEKITAELETVSQLSIRNFLKFRKEKKRERKESN